MAVEINSKKPQAEVGWYALETADGTTQYLQAKGSIKYGNPAGDGLVAQGWKFVGTEDPRLEKVEEVKEESKTSKAKK